MTIGQLAGFAGVTTKAVRHYHARGLLAEPSRDASGYRRYSVQHALDLVKIKTLAEAGVPLARIAELLATRGDRFTAAIVEIDRDLEHRIDELAHKRERIARLRGGDRLFVSAEAADYLDRLRKLGITARTVQLERDLWILVQSTAPAEAATWLARKRAALADREFCTLYRAYDRAYDWPPDDTRLVALAARTRRWLAKQPAPAARSARAPAIAQLVGASTHASPAWAQLAEMVRAQRPGTRYR